MSDVCGSCGGKVPQRARFCPHCGAWQPGEDATGAAGDALTPEWSWCEIEWVRSFRGSEFQARPLSPNGDQRLTRSPAFRWRGGQPPPETHADAREAHEALVSVLVAADWEPIGGDGPWYAERFRRPVSPTPAGLSVERQAGPEVSEPAASASGSTPPPVPESLPAARPAPPEVSAPATAPPPGAGAERPLLPMVVIEPRETPFLARAGIVALTVVSIAIIIFTFLVLLGHFRGGGKGKHATPAVHVLRA